MAKSQYVTDSVGVTDYIQKLNSDFGEMVEAVRQVILRANEDISEYIKWNAPSFFYTGQMPPFDPKEYKRDLIVMNLRKEVVLLVFPTGALINDTTGLLEGNYSDGRRLVTFKSLEDVRGRAADLHVVINEWVRSINA